MRSVKRMPSVLACVLTIVCAFAAEANDSDITSEPATRIGLDASNYENFFERIRPLVTGQHEFSGLAFYLNKIDFFVAEDGNPTAVAAGEELILEPGQSFVAKGRLEVLVVKAPGLAISVGDQRFEISAAPPGPIQARIHAASSPQLRAEIPELDGLRYSHLGRPLAVLARGVEWSLVSLHHLGLGNWGVVIIVFAVLLKILLFPLSVLSVRLQRSVSQCTTQLAPRLAEIKANYDGEEAHNRIMAAHRELGITPFYALKPMMTNMVQILFLVAIFNALGEMPQISGASFLWIEDLAYPDVIATLPTAVPMLGDKVSVLPFAMTAISIMSTLIFKNPHALPADLRAQKRNLYVMAAAFFVLFYPFPAAMVLFWTLANVLQTVQQQLLKL